MIFSSCPKFRPPKLIDSPFETVTLFGEIVDVIFGVVVPVPVPVPLPTRAMSV